MKYTTKYDIDDRVFMMLSNSIVECDIVGIKIQISSYNSKTITYTLEIEGYSEMSEHQSYLYATKAELIATL